MKSLLKDAFAGLLALLARAILHKYKPQIVMITGSVGKTSTKDAAFAAVSKAYYARASEKSYNSEFGVPLTIIGAKNPWSSLVGWISVLEEALALIFLPSHYPKLLVLEVGADRPGDLARILRIATPDAVIVTRLPDVPVHVEAYATPAAVREEEFAPAYALAAGAPLIISSRDTFAIEMARNTQAKITLFGFSTGADVHLEEPTVLLSGEEVPLGMQTIAHVEERTYALTAPGALGRPQVLAPAAGFALALALGIPPEVALEGLATYTPPPGRGRILAGHAGSILIDDSYNASPAAVEEAVHALKLLPKKGRHIAALGDMLELGRYSAEEHTRIGRLVAEESDMLVAVGPRSRAMRDSAVLAGMPEERALWFETAVEAARALFELVRMDDVVLVKGSQGIRMERICEALLAHPADAKLLVRQEREWKKRP